VNKYKIPFNRPAIVGNELSYISQAVSSGHIGGDGSFSRRCQQLLGERFGAEQVLITTSCSSALEMCALLSEIEPGDEVIMPSYTFVSTANAFALRGAKIVFVDIRPDTMNLDEVQLASFVTDRTRVIVPVHYAGVACEMDTIMEVAEKAGALVVEDAAQGVNAKYRGQYLGTIGDLGAYSFHETKNFICGEGGALLTNNPRFRDRAEIIREKGTNRSQFFRGQIDKYTWMEIGSSYVQSDILSAFLFAQLENMDLITRTRRAVFDQYVQALQPLAQRGVLQLPVIPAHCSTNYHMFYVLLEKGSVRNQLIEHLAREGILAVFHYVPLHSSPVGQKMGYRRGMLPVTEDVSERLLRLPMFHELAASEVETIVASIRGFFGQA
jgi:dTDP-4-amino-4,6-dideoxygalactose transaminase